MKKTLTLALTLILVLALALPALAAEWSLPASKNDVTENPVGVWTFMEKTTAYTMAQKQDPYDVGAFFRSDLTSVGKNGDLYELFSQDDTAYPVIRFTAPEDGTYTISAFTFQRKDGWDNSGNEEVFRIAKNGTDIYESAGVPIGDNDTSVAPDAVEMKAGDTLDFYAPVTDAGCQLDALFSGITIKSSGGGEATTPAATESGNKKATEAPETPAKTADSSLLLLISAVFVLFAGGVLLLKRKSTVK